MYENSKLLLASPIPIRAQSSNVRKLEAFIGEPNTYESPLTECKKLEALLRAQLKLSATILVSPCKVQASKLRAGSWRLRATGPTKEINPRAQPREAKLDKASQPSPSNPTKPKPSQQAHS